MESDGDTNFNWCTRKVDEGLVKRLKELEIEERSNTIQTMALLKSTRILRKLSGKLEETCCHSDSNESISPNASLKNSEGIIII